MSPDNPDPGTVGWQLAARMYAPHRPPAELAASGRSPAPPLTLLPDDLAVITLARWCGADTATSSPPQPGRPGAGPVPTVEAASGFTRLTRLRVAKAAGNRLALHSLTVATGGGRLWLLEGDWWQQAIPVSADGLGEQISALLRPSMTAPRPS